VPNGTLQRILNEELLEAGLASSLISFDAI
jgi:hypothetical protein